MNDMNPAYLTKGIVEQQKAEIDLLTEKVTLSQYEVTQQQTIVNSLVTKSGQFAAFLTEATANKASSLANRDQVNDVAASVANLLICVGKASQQTGSATDSMSDVAGEVADLIDKLIFSVEIINKLTQLINKQKSINPLIPDSLIAFMAKAGTDANNAIALTLTALQSCYAAEATLLESQSLVDLSKKQTDALSSRITKGWDSRTGTSDVKAEVGKTDNCLGIVALLNQAYQNSVQQYEDALWNNTSVGKQLSYAQAQLAAATTRLNSYQSGLAAAKAAAFAS